MAVVIAVAGLASIIALPAEAASKVFAAKAAHARTTLDSAEAALQQMQAGETGTAAVTLRQAIDTEPGNTLLHNLSAALLMLTGDSRGAASEWNVTLADSPGDPLALYGLGLVSLARGDRAQALDRFQLAERNGDRSACMLAARYVEILSGAKGGGAGLVLPDSFAATARAISGMAAARSGDHRRAAADLGAAITALPGDPFGEPFGLVMTFKKDSPIRSAALPLPTGHGLVTRRGGSVEKKYSGVITLKPDNIDSYTGFVAFKIDGTVSSIVNTSPFSLVWNTARVPNGAHRVEMVIYDHQGQEISKAAKELHTSNVDAPSATVKDSALEGRIDEVRAGLWSSLLLLPSRHALAYAAWESARAAGDQEAAAQYLSLSAALDPDYAGTRARWVASAGSLLSQAAPPLYRGAPNDNVIALTFDDGPKPGVTEMLVNVLKQENIPATFFVIGRHAAANPNLVKLIADAGFEIENHSYTHANLTMLSRISIERELMRTIAAVQSATGRRMRYFRPPGGNLNSEVTKVAAEWGLTPCMWTVTADSLEYGNGDQLVEFVLKHAQPGGIVILHNGRMTTLEALPRIIAGFRQRGYRFVTIDQMAQRKAAALSKTAATLTAAPIH